MTVSGGIKFFDRNFAGADLYGSIMSVSTGSNTADFILDKNEYTQWLSVGSDDLTTETIVIEFDESQDIDRIFLIGINFKAYELKYWTGAAYASFTNVVGVNGASKSGIVETAQTLESAYYEFTEVSTTRVQIEIDTTQTADAEKELNRFIATSELGTLAGYPIVKDVSKSKNIRSSKLLDGRKFITKALEVYEIKIDFRNYPPSYEDDLDLVRTLIERDNSFLIWLCGGRNASNYFNYQFAGFRLQDIKQVQISNIVKDAYNKNYYNGGINTAIIITEAF